MANLRHYLVSRLDLNVTPYPKTCFCRMNPNFFLDVLKDNPSQLPIRAESIILEQNIEKAVVATQHLDLDEYVRLEHCSREKVTAPRPLTSVYWGGEDHDTLYENLSLIHI